MATRNKSFFTSPLILVAFGAVMALAVACGDDDDSSGNPAPKGGSKNTAGTTASAGEGGTGATTSTGGKNTVAGTNSTAGTQTMQTGGAGAGPTPENGGAGAANGGASGAPDCIDETDKGCYSCKPTTTDQFLNHCPTTGCEPFDNTKLTSLSKVPKP